MDETIDPQVKNLVSAIGRAETGDSSPEAYTKSGESGEYGRYQFMPNTWKEWSGKILKDPNAPMTIENQNKVAYETVKAWKAEGLTPAQIASRWNSGDENKYKQGWKGTVTLPSGKQVEYDTPTYTQKVSDYYNQSKSGFNPTPFSKPGQLDITGAAAETTPTTPAALTGLPEQLTKRATEAGTSAGKALTGVADIFQGKSVEGGKKIFHGAIQTAGAAAGAFGDVIGKIIEKTPVIGDFVKSIENVIGAGATEFANSESGQAIVKSVADWTKQHPEMAKDIGAGINIASAIPILKGIGALKNVALDAASMALKTTAENSVKNDLAAALTKSGQKAVAKSPNAIQTLIDERALPEIIEGKYSTQEAKQIIGDKISHINESELQPLLEQISSQQTIGQDLSTLKKLAIKEAESDPLLMEAGVVPKAIKQIEDRFAGWEHSYGNTIKLNTQNRLKIGSGKFSDWGTPEHSADKAIYRALQKNIEEIAAKNGLADVGEINARMSELIKSLDVLPYIEGRPIKLGTVGGMIKNIATGAGEMAGSAVSTPIAGAFIGRQTGGYVGKKIAGMGQGILERTGKGAIRQSPKSVLKKTSGAIAASEANKINR